MTPGSASPAGGRPLVFAHRGSSALLPEHTLAAYRQALAEGADGVECDVRLTRDGHLVCLHDRRLERTSTGRGVVSTHTLAELDQLDFGSWRPDLPDTADDLVFRREMPGDEQPVRDDEGRVLTLDRLLGALSGARRPIRLLVETKHPTRYGNTVERTLVSLLARRGLLNPTGPGAGARPKVTMMSFSPRAVRLVRSLAPELPTVLLLDRLPVGVRLARLPFGVRIAGPGIGMVRKRPSLVRRLLERGNQVYVWTVNEPDDVDLVLDLGVHGVISDRPAQVLARIAARANA
ncbi:MAG TPA: glycerophosphodiester phosphodiesterase family protein [Micromonosporaceae bacterium]|nr:glycerophosphodiester phosphodiesterase family protein [Micromonosporaceae bacterium]